MALPADFFEKKNGAIPVRWVDLRQFPRFYFRSAAAIEVQSTLPALPRSPQAVRGYVKDISRAAVAVLHSEQLFPGERLWVTVLDGVRRSTTVTALPSHPRQLLRGRCPVRRRANGGRVTAGHFARH